MRMITKTATSRSRNRNHMPAPSLTAPISGAAGAAIEGGATQRTDRAAEHGVTVTLGQLVRMRTSRGPGERCGKVTPTRRGHQTCDQQRRCDQQHLSWPQHTDHPGQRSLR